MPLAQRPPSSCWRSPRRSKPPRRTSSSPPRTSSFSRVPTPLLLSLIALSPGNQQHQEPLCLHERERPWPPDPAVEAAATTPPTSPSSAVAFAPSSSPLQTSPASKLLSWCARSSPPLWPELAGASSCATRSPKRRTSPRPPRPRPAPRIPTSAPSLFLLPLMISLSFRCGQELRPAMAAPRSSRDARRPDPSLPPWIRVRLMRESSRRPAGPLHRHAPPLLSASCRNTSVARRPSTARLGRPIAKQVSPTWASRHHRPGPRPMSSESVRGVRIRSSTSRIVYFMDSFFFQAGSRDFDDSSGYLEVEIFHQDSANTTGDSAVEEFQRDVWLVCDG